MPSLQPLGDRQAWHLQELWRQRHHRRNINYEKLDAFLCDECGFCKHARFDFTLVVKPSYVVERISNEAEYEKLLARIDTELQNANKRHSQLATLKRPLERLLGHPADAVLQLFGAAGAGAGAAGGSGIGMPSIGLGGGLGAPGGMAELPAGLRSSAGVGAAGIPDPTEALLASMPGAATLRIHRKITILALLYAREAKRVNEALSQSSQVLQAARTDLSCTGCRASDGEATEPIVE